MSRLLGHALLQSFQSGEQLQSAEALYGSGQQTFLRAVFHEAFVLEKQIVQNMQLSGGHHEVLQALVIGALGESAD